MIHEFKWAYMRKYKILQDFAMRYPDEKLSDLVGPQRGDTRRIVTEMFAKTSSSQGDENRRPTPQKKKDSEKGADGSTLERTTKKKKAKKTSPLDPPGEGKKKAVKCKKGQGNESGFITSEPPQEKKQKGERKKKKKKKAKGTLSATLRRVPNAELPVVPEMPPGAAQVAVEQRSGMDEQLEAHLLGAEPPATVAQPSQTVSSSMAPQVPDMGGFLARFRKSISQAGARLVLVATPVPRQPKQSWVPVPMAEPQMTKHPTVSELLARQATGEIPEEPTPEVPQPTALRSPSAREVSAMETGEQEPIAMDVEMQEEPMVPSSGAANG